MPNPVLIVGAGPTGLTAAFELSRQGVAVRIVDKCAVPSETSRALGVQARTLELMEPRGLAEEMVQRGFPARGGNVYGDGKHLFRLDLSAIDSPFNYVLILSQAETEAILARHLAERGGRIERGVELVAFAQDAHSREDDPVRAVLRHPDGTLEEARAPWLIAADGAHSLMRTTLDLPFEGKTFDAAFVLGDLQATSDLVQGDVHIFSSAHGLMAMFPLGSGRFRIIADNPPAMPSPTLEELQRIYDERSYIPARFSDLAWSSTFRINSRMISELRIGRIFLGGDAAHIHSPAGGQGMNTGIQDMINLCWKLALVMKGRAAPSLLDTYAAERLPVMRRVLSRTETLTNAAASREPFVRGLIDNLGPWIGGSHFVQEVAVAQMSQLAITYRDGPLSESRGNHGKLHAGDRVPDVPVRLPSSRGGQDSDARLFRLLDPTRFTLLATHAGAGQQLPESLAPWSDLAAYFAVAPQQNDGARAKFIEAFGNQPSFFLIRPDGYLALACERGSPGEIVTFLRKWMLPAVMPESGMP